MIAIGSSAQLLSNSILLAMVAGIPLYGVIRKVNIFENFVLGAKDGLLLMLRIFPYLLAMIVAIGMFRASGAIDVMAQYIGPWLNKLGLPTPVLPLALLRPFSGSATNGMLAELAHTYGGNSYIAHLAGTIMGSTETTFYVVAVYFGAVSIRRTRHAIPAGLFADLVGVVAAVWICGRVFLHN